MPPELLAALADKCYYLAMDLSTGERTELRALANGPDVSARIATRARIVLWSAEGRMKKDIAVLAGVSRPTVDFWIDRYGSGGVAALNDRPSGAPREQVPPAVRGRILALTRCTPPVELGLSHWSSREMPWQAGTFKLSRDPAFAEKVADVVGLYLDPPGGAVVLSIDEKTQVQALDRTQPTLPLDFGKTAKQTHDYVRHGTTNLFAALNVHTGEVFGECKQTRNGQDFLDFLKRAVQPHTGKSIHVVLDNLSTHATPDVQEWLDKNQHITFHFTPVGSSWLNQVETWFGAITRQAIRRGTFTSVRVLIKRIKDYITHWNNDAKPFEWTATADEILAKVKIVQANVKKLVDNNSK
jgi:transposase